jgi:hypothetical protein
VEKTFLYPTKNKEKKIPKIDRVMTGTNGRSDFLSPYADNIRGFAD